MTEKEIVSIAQDAYVYGYPLILMEITKNVITNVEIPEEGFGPINQFSHMRKFPDHTLTEVVKPNCDTYYSIAWLDLKQEPLILSIPNTNGRYYLLPMLDAWTNVFTSPGKRTTGTESNNFLIAGPLWTGNIPEEMKQIKAPTNMVWILGRTQTNSPKDGATIVKSIQDSYKLTPLSQWGTTYSPPKGRVDQNLSKTPPVFQVKEMKIDNFFNLLNKLMLENPPSKADTPIINRIKKVGVTPGGTFNLNVFNETTKGALLTIPTKVHDAFNKSRTEASLGSLENGWNLLRKGIGKYGTDYQIRAFVAYIGLGANLPEDAIYPTTVMDSNGKPFNGKNKYVIHFEKGKLPPANAFWSITMYNSEDFLVENPINRFAIGDRDNLKFNDDGSLDIHIQHENPVLQKESNWLPAPDNVFSLVLRIYWPKEQMLDGTWKIPPVVKIE